MSDDYKTEKWAAAMAGAIGFGLDLVRGGIHNDGHTPVRYALYLSKAPGVVPAIGTEIARVDGCPLTYGGPVPGDENAHAVLVVRGWCVCGLIMIEQVAYNIGVVELDDDA